MKLLHLLFERYQDSVVDQDPGSGVFFFDSLIQIIFSLIPDPGSTTHISDSLRRK